jgi:enediyne biosynthesis protein E4
MRYIFLLAIFWNVGCQKAPKFELLSPAETGIFFVNEVIEKDSFNILQNEYMYNGGGVGVADLNNDGLEDLIFCGNKVSPAIYINLGNFKFLDITDRFIGGFKGHWVSGVSIADINEDGWPDIYFSVTMSKNPEERKNQLWINSGTLENNLPSFTEQAAQFGIDYAGHSMQAVFFDYDLDGDLDLYIMNNIVSEIVPTNYRFKLIDGSADNQDKLFRNNGDGTFTDISKEAGISIEGYGLGLGIADFNRDGYPDIYVSNDYIANDILYINQGNGTFINQSPEVLSYQSKFSMGNDVGDINHDGWPDIITLDMLPEDYQRKKQTINGNAYVFYINDEKYGYQHQYVRNMLHLNNGTIGQQLIPFSEQGQLSGIHESEWSWSALMADIDNDGDRDLLFSNGFPRDLTDKDFTNYKANMYGFLAGDEEMLEVIPVVKVPNYLMENTGDLNFINRAGEWGMGNSVFSTGAVWADLDNDGDLEYITNNINEPAYVYKNNFREQSASNYIQLRLTGTQRNTMAIGTKIEITTAQNKQWHDQFLTRGYLSSISPTIHFGLGKHEIVDTIKFFWPEGKTYSIMTNLPANQILQIERSKLQELPVPESIDPLSDFWFSEADNAIHWNHEQADFIDFYLPQRTMLRKLSQTGPALATGDLNGDGLPDVYIGGSPQQAASAFSFNGKDFVPLFLPGLTELKSAHETSVAIADIDGDGDLDVLTIGGAYSPYESTIYGHFLYKNHGTYFEKIELPVGIFAGSVIRACDYDQDGDIDFFVGARVSDNAFPLAPPSVLLINDGAGNFSPLTGEALDLGMVTDAIWVDLDGDGWNDLVVARDWNTLAIVRNNKGKSFKTEELGHFSGNWGAIIAADLNRDGKMDLIAGNLGDNHRFRISEKYPMTLYAPDIDQNGILDLLPATFYRDSTGKMTEFPVHYLDELATQSPFFRKLFTSYTQFSKYSMQDILKLGNTQNMVTRQINNTSSYIIWNRGSTFEWQKLPAVVQNAPIKAALSHDFDGDGILDLLLAGNDFTFDVSTGNMAANKGVLLKGMGNEQFDWIPYRQSGWATEGMVSQLLLLPGTPGLVIAGINRNQLKTFVIKKLQ